MNKLKELPMGVILAIGAAVLALAGFAIFRTVSNENRSLTTPMDQTRYREEMKKRASSGSYSPSGQPGSRGGGGGMMGRPGMGGGAPSGYGRPGMGGAPGGYGGGAPSGYGGR
jgi:hypothetical protein